MDNHIFQDLTAVAQAALDAARQAGADQAAASVSRSRFVDVGFRDGELEKASASTKQGLGLRLFIDGRFGVHSTSDLRPAELKTFVAKAAALTQLIQPDPLRSLADPARYARGPAPDLGLHDPALEAAEAPYWIDQSRNLVGLVQQAGRGAGSLVSAQGAAYLEVAHEVLATSAGFLGSQQETGAVMVAGVVLMDPASQGKRRSGYWWRGEHRLAGLGGQAELQTLADTAAARALRQMGAHPGPSGRASVLVENQAAGRLLGDLLGAMSGPALHQERSYLKGKQGQAVAAPLLTVEDQPLLPGGFGSRWYDAEGVAAAPFTLVRQGVLTGYYLDTYYAKALKLNPTTGSSSNVACASSTPGGFEAMLAGMERGLAVTSFLGGNFNSTTGDFSYGLQGLWVENGRVAHAVEGMNMAGNFAELWQSLARVGDDPFPYSKLRTPSLLFKEVQLSGASLASGQPLG